MGSRKYHIEISTFADKIDTSDTLKYKNNIDIESIYRPSLDMKPLACFITTCDVKCYDTRIKMADHGQQCTINKCTNFSDVFLGIQCRY